MRFNYYENAGENAGRILSYTRSLVIIAGIWNAGQDCELYFLSPGFEIEFRMHGFGKMYMGR